MCMGLHSKLKERSGGELCMNGSNNLWVFGRDQNGSQSFGKEDVRRKLTLPNAKQINWGTYTLL